MVHHRSTTPTRRLVNLRLAQRMKSQVGGSRSSPPMRRVERLELSAHQRLLIRSARYAMISIASPRKISSTAASR
jgi:hypothetical protein